MSFLIEEIDREINTIMQARKKTPLFSSFQANLPNPEICSLTKVLQKGLSSVTDQPLQFQIVQNQIMTTLLFRKVYKNLSFMLYTVVNTKSREIKLKFKLMDQDTNFAFIDSEPRKIFAAKLFLTFHRFFCQSFAQYKLAFDCDTGLIQIQSAIYFGCYQELKSLSYFFTLMIKRFFKIIQDTYDPLLSVIQLSNINPNVYICELITRRRGIRIRRFQRYSKLMNALLNLGTQDTNQSQSLQEKMFIEQQCFSSLRQNFTPIEQDLVRSLVNYQFQEVEGLFDRRLEKQLCLNQNEKKEVLSKLDIPQIKIMLDSGQRHFVVNHIKLARKINESNLTLMSSGGFSNIYLSEIQFFPISSHAVDWNDTSQFDVRDVKRKSMILKKEVSNANPFGRNRLLHEKNILLKIKSALSIFIPKYYLICSSNQEQIQYLLIEHIYLHCHTFNLEDYSKRFKLTLSQQTVVYFAYMISQGLRYLKDYGVVHLDIKLSNILIGKKLAIKIIDFGESFHCDLKEHRPGVSMPYSPPQCYGSDKTFTSKSDVYSFGVMLYKLLFSRYPSYISSQNDRQKILNGGKISDRWFFSPENLSSWGESNVLPFLQLLIGKCLHPDPDCRPEIQWVSLFLREYLDYFR